MNPVQSAVAGHAPPQREFVATGRVDTGGVAPASYGEIQALMARG